MNVKLIIAGRLPGLNEYIAADRKHRQQGAAMKRKSQSTVYGFINRQLHGVKFIRPVQMQYTWYEKDRRRDKDNISSFGRKVIQDALVTCGVIENDGWAQIEGFCDVFAVDKKEPRIEVDIWET